MRPVDVPERRARLGRRHLLAAPAADVESVAAAVAGLHSSDPATVYLSARARVAGFTVADLEDALYDRRSLLRVLGMRRTMFVVPPGLAAVVMAACTRDLVAGERRRLIGWVGDQQLATGDPEAWLDGLAADVLAALAARGEATAAELTNDVPDLAKRISFGEGRTWSGTVGMSTRVMFLLATQGRVVRARPRGSWLSSQYRWALMGEWLGEPLLELDPAGARAELVRRYLAAYGPATPIDVKWWAGWGVRDTRAALADAGAVEVGLKASTGYLLPDDVDPVASPGPWAALLPGLDPAAMGWKERDWYFGRHSPRLFDRNGNAGPTVWWCGRVVGGWAQRPSGEVAFALLEDVGAEAEAAVAAEAARLEGWLDGVVVTPRFATPLDKELRAGG